MVLGLCLEPEVIVELFDLCCCLGEEVGERPLVLVFVPCFLGEIVEDCGLDVALLFFCLGKEVLFP